MRNDVCLARLGTSVVAFGDPNDRVDHIWEAAATASALLQAVIDFSGNDELPGILFEHLENRLFDLLFSNDVAVADQHVAPDVAGGARPFSRPTGFDENLTYWNTLSGESRL